MLAVTETCTLPVAIIIIHLMPVALARVSQKWVEVQAAGTLDSRYVLMLWLGARCDSMFATMPPSSVKHVWIGKAPKSLLVDIAWVAASVQDAFGRRRCGRCSSEGINVLCPTPTLSGSFYRWTQAVSL